MFQSSVPMIGIDLESIHVHAKARKFAMCKDEFVLLLVYFSLSLHRIYAVFVAIQNATQMKLRSLLICIFFNRVLIKFQKSVLSLNTLEFCENQVVGSSIQVSISTSDGELII